MIGFENIKPEVAKDLIELINSLKGIPKTAKVSYSVKNASTGNWNKKEFNYVPLDNILEKIKENNNFAFMQPLGYDKELDKFGIKCILIHKSGYVLTSNLYEVPLQENQKIQDEGAQITYRKRYSAGAFLGVATEEDTNGNDDDAEQVKKEEPQKKITTLSPKQRDIILNVYKEENLTKLLQTNGLKSIDEMSVQKASEIIKKLNEIKKGDSNE